MNHLLLVRDTFDSQTHGLRIEDVIRKDRQNWASAQRLIFSHFQQCLNDMEHGIGGRKEDVADTRTYLHV